MIRRYMWLRLYTAILDSHKIQALPDDLFRFLIGTWCLARENNGVLPSQEAICFRLRMARTAVEKSLEALRGRALLDVNEEGCYRPHDWNDHQYESDSSAERTARWRQAHQLPSETPPRIKPGTELPPKCDQCTEECLVFVEKHGISTAQRCKCARGQYFAAKDRERKAAEALNQ